MIELIQYLLNVDEGHKTVDELMTIIHNKMSPNLEKTMSSLAEKLIKEGENRGKLERQAENSAGNVRRRGGYVFYR